jgi:hypothetical protein
MQTIKPGDFVDVRGVAVAVDGGLIVRIPGPHAIAQVHVAPHVVRNVEPRSREAVAADAILNAYPAPQKRAARK